MTRPGWLILLTERLTALLWIGYVCSAAWYVYQIVGALNIRSPARPSILFTREYMAGDLFALIGTLQWFVFGINHRRSGPAAMGSLILAGLHLLLLAIRTYILPLRWIMEHTAR